MESSRQRILNLLQARGQATVDGLAAAMVLAPATIRRHLDILQRDNLVAFTQVKKKTGRPEHAYFLTETGQETLPKRYSRLLERLVEGLSAMSSQDVKNKSGVDVLKLLIERTGVQAAPGMSHDSSLPLTQRVEQAMDVLRDEQFHPEFAEVPGGVRVVFHNCPFRSVALKNSSVCDFDYALLSTLLGPDIVKELSLADGSHSCCYLVRESPQQVAN